MSIKTELLFEPEQGLTMNLPLNKQHSMPVYLQLKEALQNQIEQGVYGSHQQLPSERYLCEHYDLSRMTARRALQELIAEGLAYTQAGKGTFVSHNPIDEIKTLNQATKQAAYCSLITHYHQVLINHLLAFRAIEAEQLIREALANFPSEMNVIELFLSVMRQTEQQWQQGQIELVAHNYAITTIRSQLIALATTTTSSFPPKAHILLACAPDDQHEIGLLALAFYLRRRNYQVTYLGNSSVALDLPKVIELVRPQLVCFSAATIRAAKQLATLSQNEALRLPQSTSNRILPLFTFGGVAFCYHPALIEEVSGVYLGNTLETAITKIEAWLQPYPAM